MALGGGASPKQRDDGSRGERAVETVRPGAQDDEEPERGRMLGSAGKFKLPMLQ